MRLSVIERVRYFAQCYPLVVLYIAALMTLSFLLDHVL